MKKTVIKPISIEVLFKILVLTFFLLSLCRLGAEIFPRMDSYTTPYYDEKTYKNLENIFNHSQYRLKNNTAVIPDETVYSYAAGAYLRGVDPILINSERTPLGKYFISLFILLLKNDKFIVFPFGLFTVLSFWFLSYDIFKNKLIATIPLSFLLFEKLVLNQFSFVPLLDIIHLPFILLTFILFNRSIRSHSYWLTAITIGLVMATKTVYSGLLLILVFAIYLSVHRLLKDIIKFLVSLPLTFLVLALSYVRTFLDGYNIYDFFRFQKWILLYDQSKIMFPFSIWRLVFFNQWQAWWGNMSILKADDWSITWPIFTGLTLLLSILWITRKIKVTPAAQVLILWFIIYGCFLSVGVASSRFLLLLLPMEYILGIYFLTIVFKNKIGKT